MSQTQLPIMALTVPPDLCWETPQTTIPIIASLLRAIFNGNEWNTGSTTPSPADRTKPWDRTNSDGTPDGVWNYYNGFWTQQHPLPPGFVGMWEGDPANIDAFDGGETAGITNMTGPFWELVTAMAGRSPMHPGTLASGAVVNVGDNFGEERHTQTVTELATHTHQFETANGQQVLAKTTGPEVNSINQTGSLKYQYADPPQTTGDSTPFNVVHPVRGILFIRRTSRLYRRR